MSQVTILIQPGPTVFDDAGSPMSSGETYTVTETDLILSYLVEGVATLVETQSSSTEVLVDKKTSKSAPASNAGTEKPQEN